MRLAAAGFAFAACVGALGASIFLGDDRLNGESTWLDTGFIGALIGVGLVADWLGMSDAPHISSRPDPDPILGASETGGEVAPVKSPKPLEPLSPLCGREAVDDC